VARPEHQTFETFALGPANLAAKECTSGLLATLGRRTVPSPLLLHGDGERGKTHLVRAVVAEAANAGFPARYLSAADVGELAALPRLRGRGPWRRRREPAPPVLLVVDDLALWPEGGNARARVLALVRELACGPGRSVVLVSNRVTPDLSALVPDAARVELRRPGHALRRDIARHMAVDAGLRLEGAVQTVLAAAFPQSLHALETAIGRLAAAQLAPGELTAARAAVLVGDLFEEPVRVPGAPVARPRHRATTRTDGDGGGTAIEDGLRELEEFIADVGRNIEAPIRRGSDVIVPLVARDGERYLLLMRPTQYLARPLRCTFVDDQGRTEVARAWPRPRVGGPFRSPSFICTSPTAEYHSVHPEHPYRAGEGSFTNTVATIFAALHAPEYGGRLRR
jgi:hypothetical protein